MSITLEIKEVKPLVLHFNAFVRKFGEHDFYEFCMANKDLSLELTSEGDLIILSPTGGKTGIRNSKLNLRFGLWAETDATGQVFDSSTVFKLPNGARRSPDLAWVKNERWQALTEEEQEKFPPLCPDFVAELRSPTDGLERLKAKMREYIDNGAQLGWLLDPVERRVHVYRPGAAVEILDNPQSVSGEALLPGFALDVQSLWD